MGWFDIAVAFLVCFLLSSAAAYGFLMLLFSLIG